MFDAVGELPVMEGVHKRFYDNVYAPPWQGQYLPGQELPFAHKQMYITKGLLALRRVLLREALEEELSEPLIRHLLKINGAFWGKIKNSSLETFHKVDFKYKQSLIVAKLPHGCSARPKKQ